jgi:hypothetical protein
MNIILYLIIGIIYIATLIGLAIIVVLPLLEIDGLGIWVNSDSVGYGWEIPPYVRMICAVLLILLLGGGIYFLLRGIPRL